jgi:hypothetical protein
MSIFDKLMQDAKLVDMLNSEGKLIVLGLSSLTTEYKTGKDSEALSREIFKLLDGKPWLHSIMALLFCFDMMLQDNPTTKPESEVEEMIKRMEENMRKGNKNGEGKGN